MTIALPAFAVAIIWQFTSAWNDFLFAISLTSSDRARTAPAAIAAILYSLGAGLPLPFLPAQLLWLNVVTNGLQDVALAFEPGEKGVLNRRPRRRDEPVVPWLLWERTIFTGLTMATGAPIFIKISKRELRIIIFFFS